MKAKKLIDILENKVHIIASHDDHPVEVVLSQRLINLANELYNGPAWNASQPGAAGPGPMTQTIPEQEGDYIATNQGMKKGYWKVMNIKTGDVVQSGITTKSVADGIAQKWNQGYYKSIRDTQGSHESKVEEERTPMVCQECGAHFKKTIGKGTVEVKCPKCGGYDTEPE